MTTYLPREIWQEILMNLSIKDILEMENISKEWQQIIKDNNLWYRLYERDFKEKIYDRIDCYRSYMLEYYVYNYYDF